MLKYQENNGMEEIGLVTPTPGLQSIDRNHIVLYKPMESPLPLPCGLLC